MEQDLEELRSLGRQLHALITDLRQTGWRQADLEWVVRRDFGGRAVAILDHADDLVHWVERNGVALGDTLRTARLLVTILGLLRPLPEVEDAGSADVDPGLLAKVRALLAKAESTTFPAEGEALTAKAYELMDRHAIDRLVLGSDRPEGVVARRVFIDDPYARSRFVLVSEVADACGCQSVWRKGLRLATVFGYRDEVESALVLYSSLMVQAASGMRTASANVPSSPGRKAAFRRAYLLGFARTVGRRLRASHDESVAEAIDEHGDSVLPVLASRKAAVDAVVSALGKISTMSAQASDGEGWVAGAKAAERASLVGQPAFPAVPRGIGRVGGMS